MITAETKITNKYGLEMVEPDQWNPENNGFLNGQMPNAYTFIFGSFSLGLPDADL